MVLLCLLVILVVVCWLTYLLNDSDPISPPLLFGLGFTFCALFACLLSDRWNYEMGGETFSVILGGVVVFCVASFVVRRRSTGDLIESGQTDSSRWVLPASKALNIAFLLIEIVVLIWSLQLICSTYPSDSIPGSVARYNSVIKFTDEGSDIFQFPLSQLRSVTGMLGYVFAYYVAQSIVVKKSSTFYWDIAGLIIACFIQIMSANRTTAVGFMFCFAIAYFILKRQMNKRLPVVNLKTAMIVLTVCCVFIISFQGIAQVLQGRSASSDPLTYISAYIGAQIPNLDSYITSGSASSNTEIWGYMTFRNSIRWIGTQFGISDFIYQYDLPFNSINGYSTGNVYTTFYSFIYDFGYFGMVVLIAVMAIVSQLVYSKCIKFNSGIFSSAWIVVYSIIAYALILSFFSNKFYENVIVITIVYRIIYLLLIYFFIYIFTRNKVSSE